MTRASDLRVLTHLIDAFDADIMINYQPQPPMSMTQRVSAQFTVEDNSTRRDPTAIPPWWAHHRLPREGRVAVVGPCPDEREVAHSELGWSRASQAVQRALQHAGVHKDRVTWMSACWTAPWDGSGDAKLYRMPTIDEVEYWRDMTMDALRAADVAYVLLHGVHATRLWRQDLKLVDVAGGWFLWDDRWFVTPVNHVSGVNRGGELTPDDWARQVSRFAERVNAGAGVDALDVKCVKCSVGVAIYAYDGDGVGYCRGHWIDKVGEKDRMTRQRNKTTAKRNQGALEL